MVDWHMRCWKQLVSNNAIFTWFQIQDHIQGLAIVGDLLIETSQVELVLDIILIHLEEKYKLVERMINCQSS